MVDKIKHNILTTHKEKYELFIIYMRHIQNINYFIIFFFGDIICVWPWPPKFQNNMKMSQHFNMQTEIAVRVKNLLPKLKKIALISIKKNITNSHWHLIITNWIISLKLKQYFVTIKIRPGGILDKIMICIVLIQIDYNFLKGNLFLWTWTNNNNNIFFKEWLISDLDRFRERG